MLRGLAFPNHDDFESFCTQQSDCAGIANSVGLKFARPELDVRLGRGRALTSRVMMPKASVHENCPSSRDVREIGTAGQAPDVAPVVDSQPPEDRGYERLGSGFALPHPRHSF